MVLGMADAVLELGVVCVGPVVGTCTLLEFVDAAATGFVDVELPFSCGVSLEFDWELL